jgi:hypothetical protein
MRELSLHILDILQNSVTAGATFIHLSIAEDLEKDLLVIKISDNGKGMGEELLAKVTDPFVTTRSTREVGLGIPLFAGAAQRCDGNFKIDSKQGEGTQIEALFRHSHIDRAPLGDMALTISTFIACNPDIDIEYVYTSGNDKLTFDTRVLRDTLGDVPLNHTSVVRWIREYLTLP